MQFLWEHFFVGRVEASRMVGWLGVKTEGNPGD